MHNVQRIQCCMSVSIKILNKVFSVFLINQITQISTGCKVFYVLSNGVFEGKCVNA